VKQVLEQRKGEGGKKGKQVYFETLAAILGWERKPITKARKKRNPETENKQLMGPT
jgi:hypothetical protein